MSDHFKAAAPEDNWGRAKGARFRPAREREARKEPGDCRFPIFNFRLKSVLLSAEQSAIGNRHRQLAMAPEVRYVR
jgi:hypothetical protein